MIQLSRVRLINWHNFVDSTLTFERITYLIGVNAVGKTTILDAIRYCLTTNKDFNALGNRKSARIKNNSNGINALFEQKCERFVINAV